LGKSISPLTLATVLDIIEKEWTLVLEPPRTNSAWKWVYVLWLHYTSLFYTFFVMVFL
jgi:hypothetical protein